jgi:acyl carrier protein
MDKMAKRLASCFSTVLPELTAEEIPQADATSVKSWDSVATITLIAVVEEEFGIGIEVEDPAQFDSFERILAYLREVEKNAR